MSTPYGSIVGRVLDDGGPVPGATVAAIGSAHPHRDFAAVTSVDGTFRFGSMVPGAYRLEARMRGAVRTADVQVPVGARADVVIRLGPRNGDLLFVGDGRVRVTNYLQYPWRCVCSLAITTATGIARIGSGWLASPRLVITAGHCVYMADEGGWAAQVEVIPGRNGAERPFGSAIVTARGLRSSRGWVENEDPDFDYGAILLPPDQRLGDKLGWFGYAPRSDDEVRQSVLNLAGYPGDGGNTHEEGTQWYGKGKALELTGRQVTYSIPGAPGQGGSPVWITTPQNERYCVATHTWGGTVAHGGTRLTKDVFADIAQWAAQVA
jgi:V8-like Glu-specific endopeptidase